MEPWYFCAKAEWLLWLDGILAVAALVSLGARRLPIALWTALVILAVHAAVGHKEYRFIYPLVLLAMLSGIGLAEIVSWCANSLTTRGVRGKLAAGTCGALAPRGMGGICRPCVDRPSHDLSAFY